MNSSLIPKTLGIAGLGIAMYDAVSNGLYKGNRDYNTETGNMISDVFINHQMAYSESEGLEKAKGIYRTLLLDDNVVTQLNRFKCLAVATGKEMAAYELPIGLSAGALFAPPPFNAACAAFLLLACGKVLFHDIMGIGKERLIK